MVGIQALSGTHHAFLVQVRRESERGVLYYRILYRLTEHSHLPPQECRVPAHLFYVPPQSGQSAWLQFSGGQVVRVARAL